MSRLAWNGRNFLDSIREETGEKIKEKFADKAMQTPFEIL